MASQMEQTLGFEMILGEKKCVASLEQLNIE